MISESDEGETNFRIAGIDLGKLTEPATKLIEKVAEGIGGLARPWQIERIAKAKAAARQIEAKAEIQVTELQQRALRRFVAEEAAKQKNIEAITEKAFAHLLPDSDPSKLENDWIADFFDKCRIVSDAEMQVLWAKILAGEANEPRSFSKRTLSIVATLSAQDAEMFGLYCSFCWRADNGARYSIDCETASKFWPSRNVPYVAAKMHLRDLGLLGSSGEMGCELSKVTERKFTYFDESYCVKYGPGYQQPQIALVFSGHTYPTGAGRQLMAIAGLGKLEGFAEAVMKELTQQFLPRYPLEFERITDESFS